LKAFKYEDLLGLFNGDENMGLFKPEMFDYDELIYGWNGVKGVACGCCERKSHNPFTWITCRIKYIDATLYLSSITYRWFSDKWTDFKE